MKKIFLLILIAGLLLIGGTVSYVYFNANELVSRLKPEFEKLASNALGSEVSIGSIDLGLGLQPKISVSQIAVGAKADNTESKHFNIGNVLLSVDLLPLLSKELRVTKLTIEKPFISAKKTGAGIEIGGLPPAAKHDTPSPNPANPPRITNAPPPALPLAFALEDFTLQNGTISFSDQTKEGPLAKIEISDLSVTSGLKVSDSGIELAQSKITALINQSLPFRIEAGHVALNPKTLDATLEKITLEILKSVFSIDGAINLNHLKGKILVNSNGLDLAQLTPLVPFLPALKAFPLTGTVTPELTLVLDGASQYDLSGTTKLTKISTVVNNFKISDISGSLSLNANPQGQTVKDLAPLELAFQGAPMKLGFLAGLKGTIGFLENLELSAFSGKITGKSDVSLTPPQSFHTQLDLNALSIEQALAALTGKGESPLSGTVESVNINLTGELGDALKTTTSGRINIRIKDALLKQVNIAHEAFKGLLALPFIANRLENALPAELQQELAANDTKIRSITTSLQGESGQFSTSDFILLGSFFTIRGKGSMMMSGAVDIKSAISFNEHFTTLLVARVKELRGAVDRNGELTFPLSISGTAPALLIVPDMEGLVRLGAQALVREGAEKLIDKALGGKGGPGAAKEIGKLFGF